MSRAPPTARPAGRSARRHPVSTRRHRGRRGDFLTFGPIGPTDRDELVLPAGLKYHTIIAYGAKFTLADERFGFNADFTAFIPRDAEGARGVLWVNHEYVGSQTDNNDRRR